MVCSLITSNEAHKGVRLMSTGDARPERSKEDMKELMTQLNIMI